MFPIFALLATLLHPVVRQGPETPLSVLGEAGRAVAVFVRETPELVRLHIHLPSGSDPGSVEVQLDDRALTVRAQDAEGQEIRSETIALRAPASESGATADYEGDGWLTITLRRK